MIGFRIDSLSLVSTWPHVGCRVQSDGSSGALFTRQNARTSIQAKNKESKGLFSERDRCKMRERIKIDLVYTPLHPSSSIRSVTV